MPELILDSPDLASSESALAERYAFIVQASGVGIWEYRLSNGRMVWSEAMYEMWGRDPALGPPALGEWYGMVHPEDAGRAIWDRDTIRQEGGRFEQELRVVHPDRSARHLIARARMVFDGSGEAIGYTGVNIDVTAQRRTEHRFLSLTNTLPALVWLAAADGQPTYFNDRWYEFTGQTPEHSLGGAWVEAIHPDDRERSTNVWKEAREAGSPYEIELRYRRADGRYVWHLARAVPMRDAGGDITEWFGASTDIHMRKEAEVALQRSEARFKGVFESKLMGFTIFDVPTGETLAINDTFLGMTGHSRADFEQGRWDWREFTIAEYSHLDEAAIAQARERGWWEPFEKKYRRRDGSRFPARISSAPLPGEPGQVVVGIEDISGERAAQLALQRSETQLRRGLAAAHMVAWTYHLEDGRIERSDNADQIFGPGAISVVFEERMPPEDAASDRARLEAALSGQSPHYESEFRYQHPDGRMLWLFNQGDVVRGPGGEALRVHGVCLDVTARKEAELALRALNETLEERIAAALAERMEEQRRLAQAEAERRKADALYRAYFENTPEALFVIGVTTDGHYVVEEINPAHEAGVGLKLDDIRGKRVDEILPPETAAKVTEVYQHVVDTGTIYQFREDYELHGERQHWDTSLVPMRDEQGRVIRLIGSSRNVTRQVVAEEALRQSQKMEAMGQLTGGVAHDFNNLLTPIVGALDMLQRKGIGGEREQRLIAGAAQSADRAKTLVQRLLAFARRQPIQTVAVDLTELVRGMAELIASTAGPQIRVSVNADPSLPPAKADQNQVEMAVLNLAVNARDAMPSGGSLRISVEEVTVGRQHRSQLRPGRYLQISVADTGVGMDEATLARAVEPFFSTKGVGKGTGLGLSMVHGLALQLGGALTIRSTVGVGTNVELWLPRADEGPVPKQADPVETIATPGLGTILLVDDEDLVRLSTADMLIELGYEVHEASSGDEALRIMDRGLNPDYLITDHLMPGITGTELARRLQANQPGLRVLIISGYAETEGVAPDLPRLTKPFRNAELAACLAELGAR